jgi:hypothetical protein
MPIDFPNTPATNDEYSYSGLRWKWNGSSWILIDAVSDANPIISGDRGDITVSGSGTTWTIDNGVVTPAKLSTGGPSWDTSSNLSVTGNTTLAGYTEGVTSIGTVTTSHTLNIASGTVQTVTLTASTQCTFTMPTATAGKSFTLLVKQAATTGNGTAVFTGVKWPSTGTPTITATAGRMDIVAFVSDGTNWYGSIVQGFVP